VAAANPQRDKVFKYLRGGYEYKMVWIDATGIYTYEEVRAVLEALEKENSKAYHVMDYWIRTRISKVKIAKQLKCNPSTVKRQLDNLVDMFLARLHK